MKYGKSNLIRGFNPCYYGIGFRSALFLYSYSRQPPVSILVIMELALEEQERYPGHDSVYVSILVIMELALEAVLIPFQFQITTGFNPCYYGIGFRSW